MRLYARKVEMKLVTTPKIEKKMDSGGDPPCTSYAGRYIM